VQLLWEGRTGCSVGFCRCGLDIGIPQTSCNLLSATTYVEPEALLASGIRKGAMFGRSEFIVLSLGLRQNLLHEVIMKLDRYAHSEQDLAYGLSMNCFRIRQAQGMPREPGGSQQAAQPFPIP
jgi:hypothetical protein